MNWKFLNRRFLVAVTLWVSAWALAGTSVAQADEQINVGLNVSWPGFSFLEVARQLDLAPNYDLNITIFNDPLGGHAALAAGQIDVYLSTAEYTPMAIARGTNIALVSPLNMSYGVDKVLLAPGIEPDNLKGKKVAAPAAYIGEILMGIWLDSIGLSSDDVTWVNLNAAEAVGPMMSGDLAAAYMYEPWVTRVLEYLEGARVVADTADPALLETGIFMDAMYMNTEFIENRRQAALAIIRARFEALQYWHENTDEVNQMFADFLQWSKADIESIMGTNGKFREDGLYMLGFNEAARICGSLEGDPPFGLDNGAMTKIVKRTNEWWVKLGLMDKVYDPEKGVDCSLLSDLADSGFRQSMSAR